MTIKRSDETDLSQMIYKTQVTWDLKFHSFLNAKYKKAWIQNEFQCMELLNDLNETKRSAHRLLVNSLIV